MFCKECGAQIEPGEIFCSNCGASVYEGSTSQRPEPELGQTQQAAPFRNTVPVPEPTPQKSSFPLVPLLVGLAAGLLVVLLVLLFMRSQGSVSAADVPEAQEPAAVTQDDQEASEPEDEGTDSTASDETAKETVATPEPEPEPEPETPALVQTKAPSFPNASCSSELGPDATTKYYGANNVIDGDSFTAWNEGVDGPGIGEWVKLTSSEPQVVAGMNIRAGYPKREEVYWWNNRPSQITIELSDGYWQSVRLDDLYNQWQRVDFDELHETTSVTVYIDAVYAGNRYDDTAIGDIQVF